MSKKGRRRGNRKPTNARVVENTAALRGVLATEKKIALVCLALLLASGIAIGAATKGRWFAPAALVTPVATAPAPQAGSGLTLAKEYIYGPGGRILATEELDEPPSAIVPSISSITPNTVVQGGQAFDLIVNGTNFLNNSGSVVRARINAVTSDRQTTFVSSSQLRAQITGLDIQTVVLIQISVFNPGPLGGTSSEITLTVSSAIIINPVPQISSISPTTFPVASQNLILTLLSSTSTFRTGAVVKVNNSDRTTTFVSQSQLTATLSPGDVAVPATKSITVLNPAPGGGISNIVPLTIAAPPPVGTGLRGEYFNNVSVSGVPALTRVDPVVDFNWDTLRPAPEINKNLFSARWTGQVLAPITATYKFYTFTDDGARLFVNDRPMVDHWVDQTGGLEWSNSIDLIGGQMYTIRMEFYDNSGAAQARLLWHVPQSLPKQVIPTANLFPPGTTIPQGSMLEGVHEGSNCTTIFGWAADRNAPNSSTSVDIYNGQSVLATVVANQPHAGLTIAGNHGFAYTIPSGSVLKDGFQHTITAKFNGTTTVLTGSPQTLVCTTAIPAPAAPSALTAVAVSASQIDLHWADNSNNEDGFKVERQDSGQAYQLIGSPGANVTTYSDLGRTAGVPYTYRLSAYNGGGASDPITKSVTIPPPPPPPTGPPTAPTNLTATAVSSTKINLSWSDSTNETEYRVWLKKAGGTTYTTVAVLGANVTIYSHMGLLPLTQYCYRIEASNSSGGAWNTNGDKCATTTSGPKALPSVALLSGDGTAGSNGYVEGAGTTAKWRSPAAGVVGVDPVSGVTSLFVADTENHLIRMVYLDGPAQGYSILISGSGIAGYSEGGGDPYNARYNYPRGIAAMKNERGVVEALFIGDTDNHTIRLLLPPLGGTRWRPRTLSGQQSADYKDGIAEESAYSSPYGITIGNDDFIYVADSSNGAIRKLDWQGNSSTYFQATDWSGAKFTPRGITSSQASPWIYITTLGSNSINRVTGGQIELLSSSVTGYVNGPGASSRFNKPYHLVWSDTGGDGSLFIVDTSNNRIRQFELGGVVTSAYAGTGVAGYVNGVGTSARFSGAAGIAIGPSNELYIIEAGNSGIRKVGEQ